MPHLPNVALGLLHRQLGNITTEQLRRSGLSERQIRRLQTEGTLVHVGLCVLRVPAIPHTLESRAVQVSLQHPEGFVTSTTLGTIEGLRRMPAASQIQLCVPHGARCDVPNWVRLRQSRCVPGDHIRTLENGMRVASWERLAFDLAADLSVPDLSSVVEQLIQRGHTDLDRLIEVSEVLCVPRRPGSSTFLRMLVRRHPGSAAESHPELRVLDALRRRGVPVEPQERLVLPNGKAIRIDMAVPSVRWAVEVDVHPAHLDIEGTSRDKQRDRQLHLIDWQVERVTSVDLLHERRVVEELVALFHAREARCRLLTPSTAPAVAPGTER